MTAGAGGATKRFWVKGDALSQPQLPKVRHLPGGSHVSAFLAALSGKGWHVQRCDGRVLRASRSRPILRYRVSYVEDGQEFPVEKIVIGKAYYRGDGAGTFDFMRELWGKGFSPSGTSDNETTLMTIPEPVGYVPELHLLLQGQAPGRSLYAYLDEPDSAVPHVRSTGRWLAKLHGTDAVKASPLAGSFEVEKLSVYRDALSEVAPAWTGRLADLTGAVLGGLASVPGSVRVPTHGDYQPKNIYVSRSSVTVIDWDRFALAHPARDVGHFLGQCMTMSYVRTGTFERIRSWNDAFLESYVTCAPTPLAAALPAYVARTFLEILYYKLVVRPVRDPSFLASWIDECERLLAEPA